VTSDRIDLADVEPLGWIVLTCIDREKVIDPVEYRPGWNADWDGEVHPDRETAERERDEAAAAGYDAVVCAVVPVGHVTKAANEDDATARG